MLSINYDYAGEGPDTITYCIVSGYFISGRPVKIELSNDFVKYKTYTRLNKKELTHYIVPRSEQDYYWEVALIETINMSPTTYWNFDFGDGEISNLQNVNHSFQKPGEYYVQLRVYDDDGEYGLAVISIIVKPSSEVEIDDELEVLNSYVILGSSITVILILLILLMIIYLIMKKKKDGDEEDQNDEVEK